jgi:demethylmenaquinone methyltransferase/2-methoxy-6-polyprenyl-1,4-benzoquinol methylase
MFDHFDILAPIYDNFIKAKPPETLTTLADLSSSVRLLDAGGGTGRISQYFEPLVNQVILADPMLPFPDKSFDRIIMVDALHHVCDQSKTALEFWRVLKPAGKIVIEEPDIHTWGVKLLALAEKLVLMRSHFLSGREIDDLFSSLPAEIKIHSEDHFVWVVITKDPE